MAFRMTIGHPRPWPGYPHHTGLVSASYTSNPRFRHQLSSDPASRRAPLPRRMVPVITVHRGLTPLECDIILDTPGEDACPTGPPSPAHSFLLWGAAFWTLMFFGRPFWGPLLVILGV